MNQKIRLTVLFALFIAAPAFAVDKGKIELPVDAPAPPFTLRQLDGTKIRLDEIAYPGKEKSWAKKHPVLIDFFRTDCGPCKASMPELVETYQQFHPKGLEVVLVALLESENGREKLEKYLTDKKLPFIVVVDDNEYVSKKYLGETAALPATFLVDRTGILKRTRYGAKGTMKATFQEGIEKVLAEAAAETR
jgi:peroxiredoxin